jgi:hypothetical protein
VDSRKSSKGEHVIKEAPHYPHVNLRKQRDGDEKENTVGGK